MQEQRATAISHICKGLSKIFKGLNIDIDNMEERRKLNGWSQKEDSTGSYHWAAPVAYENFHFNKEYPDQTRLFHNMAIVRVSSSLYYKNNNNCQKPYQAYCLLYYGEVSLNELKTVRKGTSGGQPPIGINWGIKEVTPTMLATVTMLVKSQFLL